MKAVTWHGKEDVRVQDVPDPTMSVACFLAVHPQGALLFDTGLGDRLVGRPPYLTRRGATMSQVVLKTLMLSGSTVPGTKLRVVKGRRGPIAPGPAGALLMRCERCR